MQPIGNQVLAKAILGEAKSVGGIVVPDSYREDSQKVEIVAVGAKVKKPFIPGVIAHRKRDIGEPVIIEGVKHFLIMQQDLLAAQK